MARAEAYLRIKLHLDPPIRLTTTDMAEFFLVGGAVPLWGGELGPHLTQFGESRGLPPCQANFHLDPYSRLATIDMDRELYGRRQSLRP